MTRQWTPKLLSLLAATCLIQAPPAGSATAPSGGELYRAYCAGCHGMEGDGFGVNSYDLDVAPRDHTDTDEMSARTDEELAKAIKQGGKAVNKSVLMPAWERNLSDDEIDRLVLYLRELCCLEAE